MRLLNVASLAFEVYRNDETRPKYAIASHRWEGEFEVTFQDVRDGRNVDTIGYQKVEAFAKYVRENLPWIEWLWIDTCCINKDSAVELSEAINLMFKWYRNAEVCLAYLIDVHLVQDRNSFRVSEWFKRGWTLQELLAPRVVIFVTNSWEVIGNKGASSHKLRGATPIGSGLEREIALTTGVPELVLYNYETSQTLSNAKKMEWMKGRETSRGEDKIYALYGILAVTLGANYGEEYEGARQRLLAAIHQRESIAEQQATQFRKIVEWLSASNPWTNHESARQRHESQTGAWLCQSDQYRIWKYQSKSGHLWVYGKAGCGKTVLCSTAIEDIQSYCETAANAAYTVFYFSFSDNQKHSSKDLVRSLAVQLGQRDPGLAMLRQAYERPDRSLSMDELKRIVLASVASYDDVFLLLDALDECPENYNVRYNTLSFLAELSREAPNLRIFATSRDVPDIRESMETLKATPLGIAANSVDLDIRKYVSTELSRDHRLSRLDAATKSLIEDTISRKADGMFRWAYCQLQELKRSKSTKPKSVATALLALPRTLDDTYERMLIGVSEEDRSDALSLLRWLAYAKKPLSLDELAEVTIIDPTDDPHADGVVDSENRGSWEDTLEILSGLVTIAGAGEANIESNVLRPNTAEDHESGLSTAQFGQRINKDTKIRLAHFSVKEYLESNRIVESIAKGFYLDPLEGHRFIAQSCLVYLMHYSCSPLKTGTMPDLLAFPLLEYAAKSWFHHSALQQCDVWTRELFLLTCEKTKRDWLGVYQPDQWWLQLFEPLQPKAGSALYYASLVGLDGVVKELLRTGHDVNARGGQFEYAIQAASIMGRDKVMRMLLQGGADANSSDSYGNAVLQSTSAEGHEEAVKILLEAGANVNAQGGYFGNALYAASEKGHEKVVRILIDAGADVNAEGGDEGNALRTALVMRHEKIVLMLLEAGAVS